MGLFLFLKILYNGLRVSSMVRIKICGITNREDALLAIAEGAHALGFIFAESPRQVKREQVRQIIEALPPFVVKVGVFVEQSPGEIREIMEACHLDVVQLHGDYTVEDARSLSKHYDTLKVFRVADASIVDQMKEYVGSVKGFLLDTYSRDAYGGTGATFNWQIAVEAKKLGVPVILSGGLDADNVVPAIETVGPYAIDISSGLEKSPGRKDPEKVKIFFEKLRKRGVLV